MLKGITNVSLNGPESIPFITSESVPVNSISIQDTIRTQQNRSTGTIPPKSESGINKQNEQNKIYSSVPASNSSNKLIKTQNISQPQVNVHTTDTSSVKVYTHTFPFEHPRTSLDEWYENNFLLTIPLKNISPEFDSIPRDSVSERAMALQATASVNPGKSTATPGFEGKLRNVSVDWLPGILLLSLFIFSWMKMLYQKYLVQVVTSVVNYNVSLRLLRERNVLFRNMALGLNLVFAINTGMFIYFILAYFGIEQIDSQNPVANIFFYSFVIILVYGIKTVICKFLGNIFLVKDEFSEYVHNINLYNKNIGLFLFPVIISFPYVPDNYKAFILYTGIFIITCLLILRIYRGFQIIMRKGVSTFYLILYLCAVEILPVLLLVKFSTTLI